MTPTVDPERVLPGLMVGASFAPPMARPPDIAALSHTQITTIGKNTSHVPAHDCPPNTAWRMLDEERRQRAGIQDAERGDRNRLERPRGRCAARERPHEECQDPEGAEIGPPPEERRDGRDTRERPARARQQRERSAQGRARDAEAARGVDVVLEGEVVELTGAQRTHQRHGEGERPAPEPDDAKGERNGDGGERHPSHHVGIHQTGTRPKRRSRR